MQPGDEPESVGSGVQSGVEAAREAMERLESGQTSKEAILDWVSSKNGLNDDPECVQWWRDCLEKILDPSLVTISFATKFVEMMQEMRDDLAKSRDPVQANCKGIAPINTPGAWASCRVFEFARKHGVTLPKNPKAKNPKVAR